MTQEMLDHSMPGKHHICTLYVQHWLPFLVCSILRITNRINNMKKCKAKKKVKKRNKIFEANKILHINIIFYMMFCDKPFHPASHSHSHSISMFGIYHGFPSFFFVSQTLTPWKCFSAWAIVGIVVVVDISFSVFCRFAIFHFGFSNK